MKNQCSQTRPKVLHLPAPLEFKTNERFFCWLLYILAELQICIYIFFHDVPRTCRSFCTSSDSEHILSRHQRNCGPISEILCGRGIFFSIADLHFSISRARIPHPPSASGFWNGGRCETSFSLCFYGPTYILILSNKLLVYICVVNK